MRIRTSIAALLAVTAPLALAAPAMAEAGEGWAGELNDKVITFFCLGVVVFFVLVVFLGTAIQTRLERRKDAEKAAKMRQRVGW
jgi:heme/copper-type cytochrome/quinol oxidase subunit 2